MVVWVAAGKTYQVLVQVDVGPGNAGHAVEPEASDGHDVAQRNGAEVVYVAQLLVVNPDHELDHHLKLTEEQSDGACRDSVI